MQSPAQLLFSKPIRRLHKSPDVASAASDRITALAMHTQFLIVPQRIRPPWHAARHPLADNHQKTSTLGRPGGSNYRQYCRPNLAPPRDSVRLYSDRVSPIGEVVLSRSGWPGVV